MRSRRATPPDPHPSPAPRGEAPCTCVVVGGGPAGLVLGLLLARAGVDVTVLEKHADFLRDFRGDTVHPTTLGLLDDLGLFERFDALRQSHVKQVRLPGPEGKQPVVADFTRLPLRHRYIAMVPQWDLLNLLAEAASAEPSFTLLTEHEVTGVLRESQRVVGVEHRSAAGRGRLFADLVVACDGRSSAVRESAGLSVREFPVAFDVWWYRIPTANPPPDALLFRASRGRVMIPIPRQGYLQVAQLGPKGSDAELRARGITALRADAAELLPEVAQQVSGIASIRDVKHLSVRLDRLRRWHAPGVLCLGDAAHAMSPVGGVGINLAVQDAVAAARLLAGPLVAGRLRGPAGDRMLAKVRRRRAAPTVLVQTLQRVMHARVIGPALAGRSIQAPRALVGILERVPQLAVIPAFIVGVGPRPERAPAWARRETFEAAEPGLSRRSPLPAHRGTR